jgi:hypothetical protein
MPREENTREEEKQEIATIAKRAWAMATFLPDRLRVIEGVEGEKRRESTGCRIRTSSSLSHETRAEQERHRRCLLQQEKWDQT